MSFLVSPFPWLLFSRSLAVSPGSQPGGPSHSCLRVSFECLLPLSHLLSDFPTSLSLSLKGHGPHSSTPFAPIDPMRLAEVGRPSQSQQFAEYRRKAERVAGLEVLKAMVVPRHSSHPGSFGIHHNNHPIYAILRSRRPVISISERSNRNVASGEDGATVGCSLYST